MVRAWKDEVLSPEGKIEVQLTGQKLKQYGPQSIASSDFMRDTETAHILSTMLGVSDKSTDFDIRTWDVGVYAGRPESEVAPSINRLYEATWEVPPGSSESFSQFADRWLKYLDRAMDYVCNTGQGPAIIVTHGRNIAVVDSYINMKRELDGETPNPAGCAYLSIADDHSLQLTIDPPKESVKLDV